VAAFFPAESGPDGIVEFVSGWRRGGRVRNPGTVIDTAVINQVAIGVENGCFRGDLDLSLTDERMLRIA